MRSSVFRRPGADAWVDQYRECQRAAPTARTGTDAKGRSLTVAGNSSSICHAIPRYMPRVARSSVAWPCLRHPPLSRPLTRPRQCHPWSSHHSALQTVELLQPIETPRPDGRFPSRDRQGAETVRAVSTPTAPSRSRLGMAPAWVSRLFAPTRAGRRTPPTPPPDSAKPTFAI